MSRKKITKVDQGTHREREIFLHEGHSLLSRRDFLGTGLMQFSAFVSAPTVLGALLQSARAQADCGGGGAVVASTMPSFIQLNLSGGAGLASNFIPRNSAGQLIQSYSLMGLGSRSLLESNRVVGDAGSPNRLETALGANGGFFFNSGFLRGLNDVVGQSFMANTVIASVVVQSRDDSNQNKFDLSTLVNRAGVTGTVLPIVSTNNFGQLATLIPPPNPLLVNSLTDLDGAVGIQGPLGALSMSRMGVAFDLIRKLSEKQAGRYLASNASEIAQLTGCATDKNVEIVGQPKPSTDPRQVAALQGIWNLAANTNPSSQDAVFAGCVYNHLIQQAASVRLNMGGYDYHNNTRTSGDQRDRDAGFVAGKILQTAAALGKRCFLFVSTDGAVRSTDSATDDTTPWVSDRGQAGLNLILMYDPAGRPALSLGAGENASAYVNQIGWITEGQAGDNNYIPAWNDERAALAVFANFLRFAYRGQGNKWKQEYDRIVPPTAALAGLPDKPISDADLNKISRVAV